MYGYGARSTVVGNSCGGHLQVHSFYVPGRAPESPPNVIASSEERKTKQTTKETQPTQQIRERDGHSVLSCSAGIGHRRFEMRPPLPLLAVLLCFAAAALQKKSPSAHNPSAATTTKTSGTNQEQRPGRHRTAPHGHRHRSPSLARLPTCLHRHTLLPHDRAGAGAMSE